ncbi:MAG: squalene synthase HpnC [Planctomycetota bacterium]
MWAIEDQLRRYGPQADHPAVPLDEARAYCRRLALGHYENFSVLSWFVRRDLRDDFAAVYSFCRWADDLGDELGDTPADRDRGTELLHWWRSQLDACFAGDARHPVFVALRATADKHRLPVEPFADLIDAFIQDQSVTRYDTWDQVLDYCTRSADPVGRIVLRLWGHRDPEMDRLSDATCTALQLVNFWQDVRRDALERDRAYLPADLCQAHGLDRDAMIDDLRHARPIDRHDRAAATVVRDACDRTAPLFATGRELIPRVAPADRPTLTLFTLGGESVLSAIRRIDHRTIDRRPKLGKTTKAALLLRAAAGKLWPARRCGDPRPAVRPA